MPRSKPSRAGDKRKFEWLGATSKRRRYKARMAKRAAQSRLTGLPFPTKLRRKLNYCEKLTLNPGAAGIPAGNVFRANGLYDPNQTGTGHQPMGFDELMTAYERYTVLGATIEVTGNGAGTGGEPVIVGIEVSESTGISGDVTTIIERGRATWKVVGTPNIGPSIRTIKQATDIGKFLGVPDVLGEHDLSGTDSSVPTRPVYFKVFMADTGSDDPGGMELIVCITYDVVFHQPRALLQS